MEICKIYRIDYSSDITLELISNRIQAGFPSPAEDFEVEKLSLADLMVKHPNATYLMRVKGNSMEPEIHSGDIVVVDRSIEPRNGMIIITSLDGEFVLKRLKISKPCVYLVADNPNYGPIELKKGQELRVWGVVIGIARVYQ